MKVSKIDAGEFSIGFQSRSFGFFPGLSALSRTGTFREPLGNLRGKFGGKINGLLKTPRKAGGEGGIRTPVTAFDRKPV